MVKIMFIFVFVCVYGTLNYDKNTRRGLPPHTEPNQEMQTIIRKTKTKIQSTS